MDTIDQTRVAIRALEKNLNSEWLLVHKKSKPPINLPANFSPLVNNKNQKFALLT